MQNLFIQMDQNYREHPAFKFEAPSWVLSRETLTCFNECYSTLRQISALLKSRSFSAMRDECLWALEEVFSSIRNQTADDFEKSFLTELQRECVRLIDDELAWYKRPTTSGFVGLEQDTTKQALLSMHKDRYFFGRLPLGAVSELQRLAEKKLVQFRANSAAGRLQREDLSVNTGGTVRAMRALLNREFQSLGVLDAVSTYTGRKTRVVGLSLEMSAPQATWWKNTIAGLERPPKTLYAHLDESISYPKSIVYLTDVTEYSGPTGCYPGAYEAIQLNPLQEIIGRVVGIVGTHPSSPLKDYYAKQYHQSVNSVNFRRHLMRLPESLRFNSHFGWDVLPGSEFERQLAGCERKMIGPAGTFIAFDGARLLHRGGLIEQGERIALQVIFSDMTFAERATGRIKRMFL